MFSPDSITRLLPQLPHLPHLGLDKKPVKPPASPPGTMVYVGGERKHRPEVCSIRYNSALLEKKDKAKLDDLASLDEGQNEWLNINGVHDIQLIQAIGTRYDLHPLILEDIVNTKQRPKFEEHDDKLFIVTKMLYLEEKSQRIIYETTCFVLAGNRLLCFQEHPGDVFDPVRERLKDPNGRMRNRGIDYLTYAMLDAIVDNYLIVLDSIGHHLEALEEAIDKHPKPEHSKHLRALRRNMVVITRTAASMREVIARLERRGDAVVDSRNKVYLQDLMDHVLQVLETVDAYREIAAGLLEDYQSAINNRTNEVMKVLTIFASIFLPLTFLAGIYGMNFDHMPELHWQYSYPVLLGVLIALAVGMFAFFKYKKWF